MNRTNTSSPFDRAPFRLSREEALFEPAEVTGKIPAWLDGALIRTCPAVFELGNWRAEHWFDGLCMMYAFRCAKGCVTYQQRTLESTTRERILRGEGAAPGFGTRAPRSLWRRLLQPVPELTDNANVNVRKIGRDIVAMTETPHQVIVDPATLGMVGHVQYTDALSGALTTAHPHFDFASNETFNVLVNLGRQSSITLVAHEASTRTRRAVGTWAPRRLPYVHSFGLTSRYGLILAHPFSIHPLRLLLSNRALSEQFVWRPDEGMRLVLIPRDGGEAREYEAQPGFIFHVIHAFDDGDDVVVDALVYPTPRIVTALSRAELEKGFPDLMPKPRRYRLRAGARRANEESLADLGFEFPQIDYRRVSGRRHSRVWGSSVAARAKGIDSRVHLLDVASGVARSFADAGFVFGEPVFVRTPGANDVEGDGVLLIVASHETAARTAMYVLDAQTLDVIGRAEIPLSVPLGFHGSFVRS